jgi:hypothetical protein
MCVLQFRAFVPSHDWWAMKFWRQNEISHQKYLALKSCTYVCSVHILKCIYSCVVIEHVGLTLIGSDQSIGPTKSTPEHMGLTWIRSEGSIGPTKSKPNRIPTAGV